ncbi:MAG: hypothetical protein JWO38_5664 [Gemmataceae bacterium]|nr:hypothetical protein [Gemmataceae bacterium]
MVRRVSVLALAALLTAAAGCRSCGDRRWFTSSGCGAPPCRLMGRSGAPEMCFDPVVGTPPVSGGVVGPGVPGEVMPGPQPDQLPYPQPNDLIPARPGVPVPPAIPVPAPGDPGAANLLPLPRGGVPVKGNK